MNIGKLAERNGKALLRIVAAAPGVVEKYAVPAEILERITAGHKDKDIQAMARVEAVADLLEYLAEQPKTAVNKPPAQTRRKKQP